MSKKFEFIFFLTNFAKLQTTHFVMKKRNLLAIFFVLCTLVACKQMPSKTEKTEQDETKTTYQTYCAGCHGNFMEKFTQKPWMDENNTITIEKSIKQGTENGMPAFGQLFSDEEIRKIANFVKKNIPKDKSQLQPAITSDGIVRSEEHNFVIDTVVTGINIPWGMAFLPNGDLLISERSGSLYRFSNGKLSPPIEGLPPIMATGQGGLLDVALHPNYAENGWIYFSYSALASESEQQATGNTAIMRARLQNNRLIDQEVIFKGTPNTQRGHHWGCKLAFDTKGFLYFGIGDRGQHFDFPQKLDNTNGKIHRIHDDGRIPADNPFVNTPNAIPSIYSYGHRNPQGTVVHPITGDVWETEHGPMGGDELNLIRPKLNYGWPVISYGKNYDGSTLTELTHKEGLEQPIHQWTPSIAPCGMTFVTGERFKKWKGNILVGSLRFNYIERIVIEGDKVVKMEKIAENIGRVRNVVMSPDGLVYVGVENPGMILRLVPVD